jgi:RimJ/RimL family protein N-acetyltransferase
MQTAMNDHSPAAFKTQRTHCVPMDASHEALFCELYSDPDLMRHVAQPLSPERAKRLFSTALKHRREGRRHEWVASDRSGMPFAIVGLVKETGEARSAEIGTVIKASHHGGGMATELLDRVMRIGFEELGLHSIGGWSIKKNQISFALMNRLGFDHVILDETPLERQPGYGWDMSAAQWKARPPINGELV